MEKRESFVFSFLFPISSIVLSRRECEVVRLGKFMYVDFKLNCLESEYALDFMVLLLIKIIIWTVKFRKKCFLMIRGINYTSFLVSEVKFVKILCDTHKNVVKDDYKI